ncbi:hypothetical protein M8J75_009557 [Diaphorina citri]|nr:hypothetical protein M8J75_009557 [Diaphorina citri]
MNNDQIVDRVLKGDLTTASWAIPRLVKIYLSSSREEETIPIQCHSINVKMCNAPCSMLHARCGGLYATLFIIRACCVVSNLSAILTTHSPMHRNRVM